MADTHEPDVADQQEQDVEAFEKTAEYKQSQTFRAHNEPTEYPSLGSGGGETEVPGHDETVNDAPDPAEPLHGSLHGNWNTPEGSR
jgi:hypothetical protein